MKMSSISDVCAIITQTRVSRNRVQLRDKDSGDLLVEEAGVVTSVEDHVTTGAEAVWGVISIFFSYALYYP